MIRVRYVPMITSITAMKNQARADRGCSILSAMMYPAARNARPSIPKTQLALGGFSPALSARIRSMAPENLTCLKALR